jgi:hypothetical protein
MADKNKGVNRIVNGATLPQGTGQVDIRKQGFTTGSYGAETFEDRIAATPPKDEDCL